MSSTLAQKKVYLRPVDTDLPVNQMQESIVLEFLLAIADGFEREGNLERAEKYREFVSKKSGQG